MNEKLRAIFKLSLAADVGFLRLKKLIQTFKDAQAVFKASKQDLIEVCGIGSKIADSILSCDLDKKADLELENASKNKINIVFFFDKDYPKNFENILDKPITLYIKGEIKDEDYNSIAIVGSRKLNTYGRSVAYDFATKFAKNSITIISGLARGVDTIAHKCAIENKSRTIAVLGNGLLVNYPPENAKLQEQIAQNGVLVSEYPLLMQPDRYTFPRRNRIIAALSKATLVCEASLKSGAVITAKYACIYGKDVYAVPGNIYSAYSQGTNALIRDGALVANSSNEVLESFNDFKSPVNESVSKPEQNLDKNQTAILNLITNSPDGIHCDLIAQKLNMNISQVSQIVFVLEVDGLIKSMPGKIYIRIR